jgi:hypothetical protein
MRRLSNGYVKKSHSCPPQCPALPAYRYFSQSSKPLGLSLQPDNLAPLFVKPFNRVWAKTDPVRQACTPNRRSPPCRAPTAGGFGWPGRGRREEESARAPAAGPQRGAAWLDSDSDEVGVRPQRRGWRRPVGRRESPGRQADWEGGGCRVGRGGPAITRLAGGPKSRVAPSLAHGIQSAVTPTPPQARRSVLQHNLESTYSPPAPWAVMGWAVLAGNGRWPVGLGPAGPGGTALRSTRVSAGFRRDRFSRAWRLGRCRGGTGGRLRSGGARLRAGIAPAAPRSLARPPPAARERRRRRLVHGCRLPAESSPHRQDGPES